MRHIYFVMGPVLVFPPLGRYNFKEKTELSGEGIYMLNEIKYVYAVYQERSFTKAAKKLFITQPALSSMVKKPLAARPAVMPRKNKAAQRAAVTSSTPRARTR